MKNTAFEQLCQLCSPNTTIDAINMVSLDWQAIWELAIRHRVVPVMADRIKQLTITPPKDVAQRIKEHNQTNLIKGMEHAREIVRLTQLFNENKIKFIVFKGIALTKLMGLELHQRHHGDIDILLADVNDLWIVDELLVKRGYTRLLPSKKLKLNPAQERHFLEYEKDLTYIEPNNQINLEIHFKFFYTYKIKEISPRQAFDNHETIKITNQSIPVMSLKDHQLYLLMHGSISYWFRLKWLCDISSISKNGKTYLEKDVLTRVYQLGIKRAVTQGLILFNSQLGAPIAKEVKDSYMLDKKAQVIVKIAQEKQMSMGSLYEKDLPLKSTLKNLSTRLLYEFNLKDGFYLRKSLLKNLSSNYRDWEVFPLPSYLFWLYFPLKPFTWGIRKLIMKR
jgi:hypothetical protein